MLSRKRNYMIHTIDLKGYRYSEHVADVVENNILLSVYLVATLNGHYVMIKVDNNESVYFLYSLEEIDHIEFINNVIEDNIDLERFHCNAEISINMDVYGEDY